MVNREVQRRIGCHVRLPAADAEALDIAARALNLSRVAWIRALVLNRLRGRLTFPRDQELSLLAVRSELRHIGLQVKDIARTVSEAAADGAPVALELAAVEALREDLRRQMLAVGEAFEGSLAYWSGSDE